MPHPIRAWFARHLDRPLTAMYARLDARQRGEHSPEPRAARRVQLPAFAPVTTAPGDGER